MGAWEIVRCVKLFVRVAFAAAGHIENSVASGEGYTLFAKRAESNQKGLFAHPAPGVGIG